MDRDKIKFYMQGCRLIIDIEDGTPDIYVILYNTETEWYSNILKYDGTINYDLNSDGIFKVYIFKSIAGVLSSNTLTINNEVYSPYRLIKTFDEGWINIVDDYFSEEVFSICKLRKCLLNLQMKMFYNSVKDCGMNKCKSDELKAQRDFLFIAVWLMEHLIEEGKDEQVKEVYASLRTCKSLCEDLTNNNKCGCNG